MAIYIKGVEMPKDCTECTLNYLDNFGYPHCGVTELVIVEGKTKGGCPLIEVPEPHGRLIDADELEGEFFYCSEADRLARLQDAPTVIEGSE